MVSARWKSRVRRRKTLRDVGEIVLGVLIALGLGAVASEIGWEVEVWQARQAIGNELGEIVGQGRERLRADRCIESKLDTIGDVLDRAADSGRLGPVGNPGNPMFRTWSTGVWDSTRSAQIASQMDREAQDDLSGVYRFVEVVNGATNEELRAWTSLYAIVGPGRRIGSAEVNELRAALSTARIAHRQIIIAGFYLDQFTRDLGLPLNRDAVRQYGERSIDVYCMPIAAHSGESYGAAPFQGAQADLRARVAAGEIRQD